MKNKNACGRPRVQVYNRAIPCTRGGGRDASDSTKTKRAGDVRGETHPYAVLYPVQDRAVLLWRGMEHHCADGDGVHPKAALDYTGGAVGSGGHWPLAARHYDHQHRRAVRLQDGRRAMRHAVRRGHRAAVHSRALCRHGAVQQLSRQRNGRSGAHRRARRRRSHHPERHRQAEKTAVHNLFGYLLATAALVLCLFFNVNNVLVVLLGAAVGLLWRRFGRGKDEEVRA